MIKESMKIAVGVLAALAIVNLLPEGAKKFFK